MSSARSAQPGACDQLDGVQEEWGLRSRDTSILCGIYSLGAGLGKKMEKRQALRPELCVLWHLKAPKVTM